MRSQSVNFNFDGWRFAVTCYEIHAIHFLTCSYPFGGSVPINLARLHASVAHYCPKQHQYEVKVLCTTSIEEAARLSRRIAEETHKTTKVRQ